MALSTIDFNASIEILFFDFRTSYLEVLFFQMNFVDRLKVDPKNNRVYVLAGEHPPTYTGGKSVSKAKLKELKKNFLGEVVQTERGGQVMYHGPGQLTLYFILNLKKHFSGPRDYVDHLFHAVKGHFKDQYDLELEYRKQGLWLKDKKVVFMGIRIKNGVVYHGISLNYCMDLSPFLKQPPCDIREGQVGNLFSSPLATLFLKDEARSLVESLPFKV